MRPTHTVWFRLQSVAWPFAFLLMLDGGRWDASERRIPPSQQRQQHGRSSAGSRRAVPGCGDGRVQSLPADAPQRCSRACSIRADFTQPSMMLASSLRTTVTDGGSAALCPLEKAEQCETVSGQQLLASAQGKPRQGTEGQRLSGFYFVSTPCKTTCGIRPTGRLGGWLESPQLSLASVAAALCSGPGG